MLTWNPPRKYQGLRTNWVHAIKVTIKPPERTTGRSLSSMAQDYHAKRLEMEEWCEENCKHNWSAIHGFWYFDKMPEAVMFKMLFGGR